ncbi:MAG: HlyD family efflux transporter periplasmic adaptor subunit [Clostridiaceae bacterium]
MKKKDIIIISLLSAAVIAISGFAYFTVSKSKASAQTSKKNYSVYTIPSPQTVFLEGSFQNIQKITYQVDSTKGTLTSINVSDKKSVTKDTVLFTYKNSQYLDQADTLNDQLDTLKDTCSKLEKSANTQSANTALLSAATASSDIQSQLDDNKKQQQKLNTQIKDLKDKAYTQVKAPFDGIVVNITSNINDSAKPILTLLTPKMQIVANVSEKDILKLTLNQTVDVTMVSTGQVLKGTITFISTSPDEVSLGTAASMPAASMQSSSASGSNSTYPVYIDVAEQKDVYPGFHAQISAIDQKELPKIPRTALISEDGKNYVGNVNDGTLKKVQVETIDFNEKYVQVKSGLNFEDKIIREIKDNMKEGDTVDITAN